MREMGWLIAILFPLMAGLEIWANNQGWVTDQFVFRIAAGICLFFGLLALGMQEWGFRQDQQFSGSLSSILFRTLGPLLSATLISVIWPELEERQLFPAFVGCYLLTLAVETILSVCLIRRWNKTTVKH